MSQKLVEGQRVKGTQLWQGPGSPLIQGKSRQRSPFWRPWLVSTALAMLLANFASWMLYQLQPPEFFATTSVVGALFGVWLARRMGWRKPWVAGLVAGACASILFFTAIVQWDPNVLIDVVAKVM